MVTFRDPYGKPRKRSARTLAEARALKGQLTADVARGEYQPVKKVPFTECALEWIDHYSGRSSRGVRPETVADYRRRLVVEAIPFFGRMPLAAIQPADIKRFARHVAARGVSASTVRLALAPVKAMLTDAFEAGDIRFNPSAGVRLALDGTGQAEDEQVKALAEEELGRLLAEVPAEWRLFLELLAQTGLRIGEAIALRWQDVDFDRRRVHVGRRYYRGGFAPPKSRYGVRDVPIGPKLAFELEACWLSKARRGARLSLVDRDRASTPTTSGEGCSSRRRDGPACPGRASTRSGTPARRRSSTAASTRSRRKSGSRITRRRSPWPSTRTCSRATCPTLSCSGVATRGQPAPPKRAETATRPKGRKPAWFLGLARPSWKPRASFNPKVAGSIPARPIYASGGMLQPASLHGSGLSRGP